MAVYPQDSAFFGHCSHALTAGRFFNRSAEGQDLAIGIPRRSDPFGTEPGAVLVVRSQSLFADGFESGDTSRWNVPAR